MANKEEQRGLSWREHHVEETLEEHERRITDNERRWLISKGALMMLAAIKGIDFTITQLGSVL